MASGGATVIHSGVAEVKNDIPSDTNVKIWRVWIERSGDEYDPNDSETTFCTGTEDHIRAYFSLKYKGRLKCIARGEYRQQEFFVSELRTVTINSESIEEWTRLHHRPTAAAAVSIDHSQNMDIITHSPAKKI